MARNRGVWTAGVVAVALMMTGCGGGSGGSGDGAAERPCSSSADSAEDFFGFPTDDVPVVAGEAVEGYSGEEDDGRWYCTGDVASEFTSGAEAYAEARALLDEAGFTVADESSYDPEEPSGYLLGDGVELQLGARTPYEGEAFLVTYRLTPAYGDVTRDDPDADEPDVALPGDFPSEVPLVDGRITEASQDTGVAGWTTFRVTVRSTQSLLDTLSAARTAVEDAGFEVVDDELPFGGGASPTFRKGPLLLDLLVSDFEGEAIQATYTVTLVPQESVALPSDLPSGLPLLDGVVHEAGYSTQYSQWELAVVADGDPDEVLAEGRALLEDAGYVLLDEYVNTDDTTVYYERARLRIGLVVGNYPPAPGLTLVEYQVRPTP